MKKFRDNGAAGAILDEYEKSIIELKNVIKDISEDLLIKIVDLDTQDEDCKSIANILTHVVQSGYTYVVEIRKWIGENATYREKAFFNSASAYEKALDNMFDYNVDLFEDYPNLLNEEKNHTEKLTTRWGGVYDVEQLLEHAIVHILRHRRQIEKFLRKENIK